jgi:hypothetical protein
MNLLKISLVTLLCFLVIIVLILVIKNRKIENIVEKSYLKIEYMRELNNYKLKVKTTENNMKTNTNREYEQIYYYKNGKYKIESANSLNFLEDDSYEKICVYNDLKQIEYYKQNYIEMTKGKLLDIFSEVINYKKTSSTVYNLSLSVREERFNGTDCYVIRFGNKNSYRDTWIDKNNYITVKGVNEDIGEFYREDVYTFDEDATNDDDVNTDILNNNVYKNYTRKHINNNASEEEKLYYGIK